MVQCFMAYRTIEWIERRLVGLLVDHYPEWSMTPTVVNIGRYLTSRIRARQAAWDLLVLKPVCVRQLCMVGILAQNVAQIDWAERVKVNAAWYLENCYISRLDDAIGFFSAVYYPRYLWSLVSEIGSRLVSWRPKPKGHALNDLEVDFVVLSVQQSVKQA